MGFEYGVSPAYGHGMKYTYRLPAVGCKGGIKWGFVPLPDASDDGKMHFLKVLPAVKNSPERTKGGVL
jgi:hypothetical protein